MSSERTEEFSRSPATNSPQAVNDLQNSDAARSNHPSNGNQTTGDSDAKPAPQAKAPVKKVSEAKIALRNRLPALDDDADVGVEKEQTVTRDGKADIGFTGTLLASAAPASAPIEGWQEYRIYHTSGGKHVFSKVTRTVVADQEDKYEAEVFDPTPSSMPSKLLKSAHDLTHTRPMTWMDAAVDFFGYDPLAKALYRKLSVKFEERIS